MRTTSLKLIAVAAALSACGAIIVTARNAQDDTLTRIAGYRHWTRVTSEPVVVPIQLSSIGG